MKPQHVRDLLARGYLAGVVAVVTIVLIVAGASRPGPFARPQIWVWAAIIASVNLLPVPVSRDLQLTLEFPLLLATSLLYQPSVAGSIAFIGSFDRREFSRETTVLKALFNRAQIAGATVVGSLVFHSLASLRDPFGPVLGAAVVATLSNYAVNTVLVSVAMRLLFLDSFALVWDRLRLGAASQFLLNYFGLGLVGVVIVELFFQSRLGFLAVAAFILPLVFARQMFFRSMALEEASKELKDRERVLRALSNRMAEERQDERMQIAGYLHDDLAQQLFRLSLQADMAKKRLRTGDSAAALKYLDGILDTKTQTSDMVRALIRDLHRSPIGRKGLAEAIRSFAEDMSRSGSTRITADVVEVALPPPIQLLIYQIAREAATNALKHAEAENIWISLVETDDGVTLAIRDDGKGFDVNQPQPEGHFGSVMMKERALVAGGTYARTSEIGAGTTIRATFPRVWLEEGEVLEASATSPVPEQAPETHQIRRAPEQRADGGSSPATDGSSNGEPSGPSAGVFGEPVRARASGAH